MEPTHVLIRPVIPRRARAGGSRQVHLPESDDAHKTEVRQAVEQLFDVGVLEVRTAWVKSKPQRRGQTAGARAWKKAIVQVREGETIPDLPWPR